MRTPSRRDPRPTHALGQRAHLVQHLAHRRFRVSALPADVSKCADSVSISAEATTAASATRDATAACSDDRTPNPIAIGNDVTRRSRGIAASNCCSVVAARASR